MFGATESGMARIDWIPPGGDASQRAKNDLATATKVIAEEGGEVLGVGSYLQKEGEKRIFYFDFVINNHTEESPPKDEEPLRCLFQS